MERRVWGANGADVVRVYDTMTPEGDARIEVTADQSDGETTVTLDVDGAERLIKNLRAAIRDAKASS
jgi:hypothetical protein